VSSFRRRMPVRLTRVHWVFIEVTIDAEIRKFCSQFNQTWISSAHQAVSNSPSNHRNLVSAAEHLAKRPLRLPQINLPGLEHEGFGQQPFAGELHSYHHHQSPHPR